MVRMAPPDQAHKPRNVAHVEAWRGRTADSPGKMGLQLAPSYANLLFVRGRRDGNADDNPARNLLAEHLPAHGVIVKGWREKRKSLYRLIARFDWPAG